MNLQFVQKTYVFSFAGQKKQINVHSVCEIIPVTKSRQLEKAVVDSIDTSTCCQGVENATPTVSTDSSTDSCLTENRAKYPIPCISSSVVEKEPTSSSDLKTCASETNTVRSTKCIEATSMIESAFDQEMHSSLHHYILCTKNNCIKLKQIGAGKGDKHYKFKHSFLMNRELSFCERTGIWW